MKRRYFLSNDLDDMDRFEGELRSAGFVDPQMHVVSRDDAGVAMRSNLTPLEAVLKKDVVRGTEVGAIIGVLGAALVLGVAYISGVTESVSWVPFIFLAIVVLGFCTWEGGLFGIQEPHNEFVRFDEDLRAGRHLFVLDMTDQQEAALDDVLAKHPRMEPAGVGTAAPEFVVQAQKKFNDAMQTLP